MDASERRARASADAADWWVRLQSEELSRAEREEYVAWLRESAVHVAEMLRMAQIHSALEQFDRWNHISTEGAADENVLEFPNSPSAPSLDALPALKEGATPPTRSEGARRRGRLIKWGGSIAASLLMVIAAGLLLPGWIGQTIEADRGERREVALNDGSVLQLDPETRLRVKLEEHSRQIILERGRALFRVARDPNRPFTVRADDTIIRAVGTSFAVDRRNQAVTVTVAEGKVAVIKESAYDSRSPDMISHEPVEPASTKPSKTKSAAVTSSSARTNIYSAEPLLLTANQQITLSTPGATEPVKTVDTDRELAWTQGRLIFDNDTVENATAEFNRYNRIQLRVTDTALANRPISGIFNASDPESFIAFIQTVAHVRIDRENEKITIASVQP